MSEFEHKLKMATSLVRAGRAVSRRDFMQLAMAAGFTVAAADQLFVDTARAAPKKGGHYKAAIGHGSTTDSIDPATYANGFTFSMSMGLMGAMLVEFAPNGNLIPALAESWEPSNGGATWAFKIRKGLEFHDGRSLTPADVVATFNYHRDEKSKSASKSLLGGVTDIKADGDNVVFTLSGPNADFPALTGDYHFNIFPAKDGSIDWQSGVGAGPYPKKNFEPGVKYEGERFKNYFRSDAAFFDSVELLSITDVSARTNALLSGDIMYMDRVDLKTIGRLKSNKKLEITNVSGNAHYTAPMLCDVAPFDKVEVRQAIKYALNRQELVDKILFGYGTAGNDIPIGKKMKFYSDPKPQYTYDPDKAKSLLKKAGLEGLKVDFSTSESAFAGAVDAGVLMAEQAKKAGIEINVIREPDDGYWDKVWLKKPWSMCYWGGRPTCDVMYTTAYAADAAWNDTHWKNARFNELLVAARGETDDKKRQEMYTEMHQLCHDDGGQVVLMFNNYVGAHSTKVAHDKDLNADWDFDGGHMFHRWWMA